MKKSFLISAIFFLFAGCTKEAKELSDKKDEIAKEVAAIEFQKLIDENLGNSDYIVLDVRTAEEFATGHIKDAQLVDFYSNFETEIKKLDKDKTYLVYCRSGNRSSQAIEIMKKAGFEKIYELKGGINEWISKGGEVIV